MPDTASHDRLLSLIQRLYAAPGTAEGWHGFLLDLCAAVDGTCVSFISHDLAARTGSVAMTARADPSAVDAYLRHWAAVDPWAHSPAASGLSQGTVFVGEQIISRAALKRTPFYNDFSRHYDIAQALTAVVESSPRALSGFSINGSDRGTSFGAGHVALLQALMPHLQRALQLHRRIVDAEGSAARSIAVLDELAHGVVMFDSGGRVVLTNRAAGCILRLRDGLVLDGAELRGARAADTTRLRRAVAAAVQTSRARGMSSGGTLTVARPSGKEPWRIVVGPLITNWIDAAPESAAAVAFLSDPERTPRPDDESLRVVFGLSPAETRVAIALMNGESIERAAEVLCVSRNTIRTHLAHLFAKTRTSRQADLVRVLLTALPLKNHPFE